MSEADQPDQQAETVAHEPAVELSLDAEPCRVMLVDDSAVTRGLVSRILESDPQIDVVASVNDGQMAINSLKRTPVDVIMLDVEMPVMDGLTALPKLIEVDPAACIIVLSTLTKQNATTTIRALQMGATECMLKPSSSREITGTEDFKTELIRKTKTLCITARKQGVRPTDPSKRRTRPKLLPHELKPSAKPPVKVATRAAAAVPMPDAIAIGSSTGGPQALFEVLKHLKSGIRQPVFITQHMPGTFTNILANHIAKQCEVDCVEASDGDPVIDGRIYVAPGGYHMLVVSREGQQFIELNEEPPENFCRPAVDPMLRSIVNVYGRRVLTLILTGMGQDGLKGSQAVVEAGGTLLAQDEETSVVWGMPGAVANAGICHEILPLTEIGPKLHSYATRLKG